MARLVVIADEDLPAKVTDALISLGYDARDVRGQRWTGIKDPQPWPKVQAAGAFFVTADKGFADIRLYPPGSHGGIPCSARTDKGPRTLSSWSTGLSRCTRSTSRSGPLRSRPIRPKRPGPPTTDGPRRRFRRGCKAHLTVGLDLHVESRSDEPSRSVDGSQCST